MSELEQIKRHFLDTLLRQVIDLGLRGRKLRGDLEAIDPYDSAYIVELMPTVDQFANSIKEASE